MKKDLIMLLLPNTGDNMSVEVYLSTLVKMGYNRKQACGSLGGGVHGGSIRIVRGVVYRI